MAPLKIQPDGSGVGIKAVLLQRAKGYAMKRGVKDSCFNLTKAERSCTTNEKECLAIINALGMFSLYIYGRFFDVVTDHHTLSQVVSSNNPSPHLGR